MNAGLLGKSYQPSRPSDIKQVPQVTGRHSCDAQDSMVQDEKAEGEISGKRSACTPSRGRNQPLPSHSTSSPGTQPQPGRAGSWDASASPYLHTPHCWPPEISSRLSECCGGAGSGELICTSRPRLHSGCLIVPNIGHGGSAIPPAAQQSRAPLAGPMLNIYLQHWFQGEWPGL